MSELDEFLKSGRNQVRRIPTRGHYDRETVYAVLDAGFLCHVGFVAESQPYVIPTLYGRDGDDLFLHGAASSRMLRNLDRNGQVCLTVTHVDGLVLARSAFHHSMNYRSAVVFGTAQLVTDAQVKEHGLFVISEQVLAGRWDESRPPNSKELKATSVLRLTIEQASAKIRVGPPSDETEDYNLPIWAGVVPMTNRFGAPIPDPQLDRAIPVAPSVAGLEADIG